MVIHFLDKRYHYAPFSNAVIGQSKWFIGQVICFSAFFGFLACSRPVCLSAAAIMVAVKGKGCGGRRPGSGRKPGSTSIRKTGMGTASKAKAKVTASPEPSAASIALLGAFLAKAAAAAAPPSVRKSGPRTWHVLAAVRCLFFFALCVPALTPPSCPRGGRRVLCAVTWLAAAAAAGRGRR